MIAYYANRFLSHATHTYTITLNLGQEFHSCEKRDCWHSADLRVLSNMFHNSILPRVQGTKPSKSYWPFN